MDHCWTMFGLHLTCRRGTSPTIVPYVIERSQNCVKTRDMHMALNWNNVLWFGLSILCHLLTVENKTSLVKEVMFSPVTVVGWSVGWFISRIGRKIYWMDFNATSMEDGSREFNGPSLLFFHSAMEIMIPSALFYCPGCYRSGSLKQQKTEWTVCAGWYSELVLLVNVVWWEWSFIYSRSPWWWNTTSGEHEKSPACKPQTPRH